MPSVTDKLRCLRAYNVAMSKLGTLPREKPMPSLLERAKELVEAACGKNHARYYRAGNDLSQIDLAVLVVEAAEIITRVPEVCDVADFDTLKLGFQARAWLRKVEGK